MGDASRSSSPPAVGEPPCSALPCPAQLANLPPTLPQRCLAAVQLQEITKPLALFPILWLLSTAAMSLWAWQLCSLCPQAPTVGGCGAVGERMDLILLLICRVSTPVTMHAAGPCQHPAVP